MTIVRIDGLPIDAISFDDAVARIVELGLARQGGYVCTPNVDHVIKARADPAFRAALLGADLRVPDGMGIVYGARIAGLDLKETVTGRLLPEAVGRQLTAAGASVCIFGGPPGTAERAGVVLRRMGISVADAFSPSATFHIGSSEDQSAVDRLRASGAAAIFVGLGAPKQELWMSFHRPDLASIALVGVGAAVDVLAGRRRAAPSWMTRVGLEWLFRLVSEPRRLARRYLWDDPPFFLWMVAERVETMRSKRG